MTADTLPVSELFGPTVQGEGPAAGRPAWFLRLMGCNLSCTWCDTPYTWDQTRFDLRAETTDLTAADIASRVPAGPGILVVTGGEPLRQQNRAAWAELIRGPGWGWELHIETNGTIAPNDATLDADLIVVSPKLDNAGTHRGRQNPALHPAWRDARHETDVHLKVVCSTADDVARAADLAASAGFPPVHTWVMPCGATPDELAATWPVVATAATRHGLSASHRLHTLAWGTERGH